MNILTIFYVKSQYPTQLAVNAQNKYDLNGTQIKHDNGKATTFKSNTQQPSLLLYVEIQYLKLL